MRAFLAIAAMAVISAQPGPARGDDRVPVAGAMIDAGKLVLVGPSAQIYIRETDRRWRRSGAGGVSVDVLGAVRDSAGRLYAVGAHTPLFVYQSGLWSASHLPGRGRVRLSPEAPVLSIGRHIYVLTGERWKRVIGAAGQVTALWAASPSHIYAATDRGTLARTDGQSWRSVRHPLPDDDPIRLLSGAPGSQLVGVSSTGEILRIDRRRATLAAVPESLAGFDAHTAGPVGSEVWLAGTAGGLEKRSVLVRIGSAGLEEVAELSSLAPGDRFAVLRGGGEGSAIVVTQRGQVHIRNADGSWQRGEIDGTLPAAPAAAGPEAGPARTR